MVNTYSKTVALFAIHPLHYYVYENLIQELSELNIDTMIVLNDVYGTNQKLGNMYKELVQFLNEKNVTYTTLTHVLEHNIVFHSLVATYYFNEMFQIAKHYFKVPYGLAKVEWGTHSTVLFFDKTFSYGDYYHKRVNIFNSDMKVGNMKFDRWFNHQVPSKETVLEEFKLDPDKKTILYLPTYGELCSIDKWTKSLSVLKEEFNIISKVHHGTKYDPEEAHRYAMVHQFSDYVLSDEYDLLKLFNIADFVFSDNSGAIFDAILADKNTVLLNIDLDIDDSVYSNNESIEQQVRNEIVSVSNRSELMDVLKNAPLFEEQKNIREKINSELYEYRDGNSSKRIADVLAEYVLNQNKDEEKNYYREHLVSYIKQLNAANGQLNQMNAQYLAYIDKLKNLLERAVGKNE